MRKGKMLILLIIMLGITFNSCDNDNRNEKLEDGFVTKVGNYQISNNEFSLFKTDDGSLNFRLEDQNKNLLFERSKTSGFSDFHRWGLYFDDDLNLWYYSADVGDTYVWIRNENGQYERHNFCSENMEIPSVFLKRINKTKEKICRYVND